MKLIEVRERLAKLNVPAVTLQDAIGVMQIEKTHASHLMARLVNAGSLLKVRRGLWAWPQTDPLCIPTYLTSPVPCYISLQSALFYHGVIDQIPGSCFVVTPGRTLHIKTILGAFSIHHINADLFFGFETFYNPFFQMATPEKALLDYLYLGRHAPALFGALPEVDKSQLKIDRLMKMINSLQSEATKTFLKEKFKNLM